MITTNTSAATNPQLSLLPPGTSAPILAVFDGRGLSIPTQENDGIGYAGDIAPAMTGEDFSWFLTRVPGAFVWIGNGPAENGRELHNPLYDFNDEVLPTASKFLAEAAKRALSAS